MRKWQESLRLVRPELACLGCRAFRTPLPVILGGPTCCIPPDILVHCRRADNCAHPVLLQGTLVHHSLHVTSTTVPYISCGQLAWACIDGACTYHQSSCMQRIVRPRNALGSLPQAHFFWQSGSWCLLLDTGV